MEVMEYQHLLSLLRPPADVGQLNRYLAAAANALGARSNADLARIMNISPSTVANWKRRGGVSGDHVLWFTTNFVPKVFAYNREMPQVGPVARAISAMALHQIMAAGEKLTDDTAVGLANKVAGMFAMAQFLLSVWRAKSPSLTEAIEALAPLVVIAAEHEL